MKFIPKDIDAYIDAQPENDQAALEKFTRLLKQQFRMRRNYPAIRISKRLGTGIFGGVEFIMEKLEGDCLAFAHAGRYIIQ